MLPVLATAIGITGAATFPEAGTTFNDVQVAILVLWGVLILFPLHDADIAVQSFRRAAWAGGLFGVAAGIKLTGGVYAPGAALALMACVAPWRRSILSAVCFSFGWLAGFALSYSWWGYLLWEQTANPIFPFLNRLFLSTWFPPSNFSSSYHLKSWFDFLAYPFYWIRSNQELVTELPFRDAQFALGLTAAVLLLAIDVLGRSRRSSSPPTIRTSLNSRLLRFIAVFVLVSYLLWLPNFVTLRYAIAIEVLMGSLILTAGYVMAQQLFPQRFQHAGVVVGAVAVLATMAVHTRYPQWARREYGARVFSVAVPAMPPGSLIIINDAPMAYTLPFVRSPRWSAVGVTTLTIPGYRAYEETKNRIAAHSGAIFVLYNSLEPGFFRPRIADLGVVWDNANCRPVNSNMSWGLQLCDARRP